MPTAKSHHNIMPSWSASQSSTEYLIGSENGPSPTWLILHKVNRVKSTITMVGGVSISKIPTATFSRLSHAPTVVAVGIHESLRLKWSSTIFPHTGGACAHPSGVR